MSTERCTVFRLDLNDAERAADDPALAALMRDGWTVISDIPISDPKEPHVLLFLAPPAGRSPKLRDFPWSSLVFGMIGLLAGLSVAAWVAP